MAGTLGWEKRSPLIGKLLAGIRNPLMGKEQFPREGKVSPETSGTAARDKRKRHTLGKGATDAGVPEGIMC